jgi:hypothetical protein
MERIFRVNGKEFADEKEALKYEEELKQKELERKKKLQAEETMLNCIKEKAKEITDLVKEYRKATGKKLYFTEYNGELKVVERYASLFDDLFWF